MKRRTAKAVGIAASLLSCGLSCPAQQTAVDGQAVDSRDPLRETGSEREHLTGDWGGLRRDLVERGLHFQFGYIGEVFGNLSGGIRRDAVYEGLAKMALEVEFEKLVGWRGATFRASSLWLHGRGPSGKLTGDALGASNIEGYNSLRLYELWLEQSVFNDTLSVRVGSLLADEEFAGTEYGGQLLNSAFGWPAFVSGNVINTGPAFYASALGARVRYSPSDRWYVQSGVYDGDTFDTVDGERRLTHSGTHWNLNSRQGAFVMSEVGGQWNRGKDSVGLPGLVRLGGWVHTADFADSHRPGRDHDGNWGLYISGQQMLWREGTQGDEGLGVFCRVGGSPPDRGAFTFVVDAGLHYTGLIPARDQDKVALGFVHADFTTSVGRTSYRALDDYEELVELAYEFVVAPWFRLQPDAQWIHQPGHGDDAFLLGLRSTITF